MVRVVDRMTPYPCSGRYRTSTLLSGRAGYPARGGGLWLRIILPAGLVTWLVPSG